MPAESINMHLPTEREIEELIQGVSDVTPLKQGGQKAVYRATHTDFGAVVVKVLLDAQADERVRREVEIAMAGCFPHVPRMHTWGEADLRGVAYLYVVEQFISGGDLRQALSDGPLTIGQVLVLIGDLLDTVSVMEERGVVHRDIKPENIVVGEDNHFWLLDFGIARDLRRTSLTATAAHFGPHTAGYSAPEQFRNMKKRIDSKCDLFSLGVVAHECLTGNHPFAANARDYLDVLRKTEDLAIAPLVIEEDPTDELARFILILMDRFPSRRPPSAAFARQWFSEIMNKRLQHPRTRSL